MQTSTLEETLTKILARDSRYHREAYRFLREALDYTQKSINKSSKGETRHVSGQELLEGIRVYALSQFGPMATMVLKEWGVRSCEDFGELVFNLVENGLLSKTEKDSREDFKGGYTFEAAFRDPFLPQRCSVSPETQPSKL